MLVLRKITGNLVPAIPRFEIYDPHEIKLPDDEQSLFYYPAFAGAKRACKAENDW